MVHPVDGPLTVPTYRCPGGLGDPLATPNRANTLEVPSAVTRRPSHQSGWKYISIRAKRHTSRIDNSVHERCENAAWTDLIHRYGTFCPRDTQGDEEIPRCIDGWIRHW